MSQTPPILGGGPGPPPHPSFPESPHADRIGSSSREPGKVNPLLTALLCGFPGSWFGPWGCAFIRTLPLKMGGGMCAVVRAVVSQNPGCGAPKDFCALRTVWNLCGYQGMCVWGFGGSRSPAGDRMGDTESGQCDSPVVRPDQAFLKVRHRPAQCTSLWYLL